MAKKIDVFDELEKETAPEVDKSAKSEGGFDLLDSLAEEASAGGGKPWIPEKEDDAIQGYVRAIYTVPSEYTASGEVPALDIEDRDGQLWTARCYHSYLADAVTRKDPKVGWAIAIRYGGKVTSKNGRDYHAYTVAAKDVG